MQLLKEDLIWCLRRMPKEVFNLLAQNPHLCVAGGFIRACVAGETVSDIDVFSPSVEKAQQAADALCSSACVGRFASDNAITVYTKLPTQFIHRWVYDKPEQVLPSFDFTIARAVIWYDAEKNQWQSLCDERFYNDLAAKRLVYCSPERNEDAGGSLLRVLKFYQRGYRIPLDSLGSVITRLLRGVQTDNVLFWKAQNLNGGFVDGPELDAYRAKIVTGLLREVDPNVDPTAHSHFPSIAEQNQDGTTPT